MKHALVCWIGNTDLDAAAGIPKAGIGPIARAVEARPFDEIHLLSDYPERKVKAYIAWLRARTSAGVVLRLEKLSSPVHMGDIYQAESRAIEEIFARHKKGVALTAHLSPGTPAMAAVWILLVKTRFPSVELISSSKEGVQTADIPFDISAEFLPDLLRRPDAELTRRSMGLAPEAPEFQDIIHQCLPMKRLISRARKVALRSVAVLLEGESGTGKELFARAIHQASLRKNKPFVPVNCGAIPESLVEAELFGHEKGAFTGADKKRSGHFQEADGGTLFLDELGELPLAVQVKLLRVLQEGEVTPVGASKPVKVDVRIISATHRNLLEEVKEGRFREDLFYRLAVAILHIPPLRERKGDVGPLIDSLLQKVNQDSDKDPGFVHKKLSLGARNLLIHHPWPGNIRELYNTLQRAAIWSEGDTIRPEDIREALLPGTRPVQEDAFHQPLGDGFVLEELLDKVSRHYLERALKESGGKKIKAASLLGFKNYQTLSGWMERLGIKG